MTIKRICFFSVGFAHNRLARMIFYERILPKNVEMYLFVTNKHLDSSNWKLKRTKLFIHEDSIFSCSTSLRKFCNKNKIERLVNLGTPGAVYPFLIATVFSDTDFLIGFYGEVLRKYKLKKYKLKNNFQKAKAVLNIFTYFLAAQFSKKNNFIVFENYLEGPNYFLFPKNKSYYLQMPINTQLFKPHNKVSSRRKIGLPVKKEIVLLVGRVNYGKCADIYKGLIERNPNTLFILIGKWITKEIPKFKRSNLIYFKRKNQNELVDFYNSADITFCMHRDGSQIGIVAEESLACGTPIIHSKEISFKKSPAIVRCSYNVKDVNKSMNLLLSLSADLRKTAREYAQKYCSEEVWAERFRDFYLIK